MTSLDQHLVRRDAGLVQLLDPPFDKSALDPGYIKGYVPGVRENGGQYTHAAIWATMAFAALGDSARAWELLRMINPVNHGVDAASMWTSTRSSRTWSAPTSTRVAPHTGRGGWTLVHRLRRLDVPADRRVAARPAAGSRQAALRAVLPPEWDGFSMDYRHRDTLYRIDVRQSDAGSPGSVWLDGVVQPAACITLADDGIEHSVQLDCPRRA